MKILNIYSILFILGWTFAQDGIQLSEKCSSELLKYSECLETMDSLKLDQMKLSEKVKLYCETFKYDKCQSFLEDVYLENTNCITEEKNSLDNISGLSIQSLKITYLTFCATDKNGNLCPLSNYYTTNADILENYIMFDNSTEMLTNAVNDCKIEECNQRILSIDSIGNTLKGIISKQSVSTVSISDPSNIEPYVQYYKSNKCNDILKNSTISKYKLTYSFIIMIKELINAIEINAVTTSETLDIASKFTSKFNEYSKENNLNIELYLNIFTNFNSTVERDVLLETFIKKNPPKYDIFFFDSRDTSKYGKYLLNLNDLVPEDHVKMYDENILSQIGYCDNHLVSFPVQIITNVLYSNQKFLNKYNKSIPKTWDELIDTAKYILEEERKLGNTDLIGYNGIFDDTNEGLYSLTEFIYSCRDSTNSQFPDLNSKTATDALKLIKKIKNEISSDEIFKKNLYFTVEKLISGEALFLKFYDSYFNSPDLRKSNMPGIKEGISGSILSGTNIGISGNIKNEKVNAAVEALKFVTSKEFQKNLVLSEYIISGITSLYDDESVCMEKDCELFKNLQTVTPPKNILSNTDFKKNYLNYFHDYLYGSDSLENVLSKMHDLTTSNLECIFINSLYNKTITENCCNMKGITCDNNGHIITVELGGKSNSKKRDQTKIEMPKSFGYMPLLETLKINDLGLKGSIPSDFDNLPQLKELDLSGNKLEGNIPESLGNLENLESLNLSGNGLEGNIPESLGNLENLESLNLSGNGLEGNIPASLGNLEKLESLNLGNNTISGDIPASLGNLEKLESLNLSGNGLEGNIPEELGNLKNLESLDLGDNNITGDVPESFENLTSLKSLELNGNEELKTEIPEGLNKQLEEAKKNESNSSAFNYFKRSNLFFTLMLIIIWWMYIF
ncbi:L domain-like protein [Anaeromyces robustus]|uniref:L domain-like protein n=1 Tax=Anaeromyces robustus TaxID=1754192 RepID=A0A1Y1XDP7_9FUNG|nr:L domain-like protein [Anaeromyces robustus]|eukprot:ORX83494.1 L domain-like protein [Anaeromyces robustus]